MTLTTIYSLIIAAVPSFVSILGIVCCVAKFGNQVGEIKKEVVKQKEFKELKDQFR